jgi:hypothetical protein
MSFDEDDVLLWIPRCSCGDWRGANVSAGPDGIDQEGQREAWSNWDEHRRTSPYGWHQLRWDLHEQPGFNGPT